MNRLPVFWVCGAVAAGKSVTAWALYTALAARGTAVAYLDIDQVGMLYPATEADPQRHRLKAHAVARLAPGYAAAGAQVLVVSGVVDPAAGPELDALDLTLCLLSPSPDALRARVLARGAGTDDAEQAVAEDAVLRRAGFVDAVVDTAGLSVVQAASRLREYVRVVPASPAAVHRVSSADVPIVLLTGPRAVGLSTVGFSLAMNRWRRGAPTGFLDLQQLAFVAGAPAGGLALTQLAAMHEHLSASGAAAVVVNGHLRADEARALAGVFPAARMTPVRLRADADTLRAHVRERATRPTTRLAGDDLVGATSEHQQAVVEEAVEQLRRDDHACGDLVIDVSGRSPAEVVARIEELLPDGT